MKEELKHSFLKRILSNMTRDDFQSSPIQLTIEMYSTYSVLVGQVNLFEIFLFELLKNHCLYKQCILFIISLKN